MANKDDKGHYLTTGERIRNFTGWAFALAILLELITAPFAHQYGGNAQQAKEVVTQIRHIKVKPPPTPPPPTPTPPPTPQPHTTPQPHVQTNNRPVLVHPPKVTTNGAGGNQQTYHAPKNACSGPNCTGTATQTAPPAPVATQASCPVPNKAATVIDKADAEYPESVEELNLGNVDVGVEVTVGASGQLQAASIYSSSHNSQLDQSALRAARSSTYSPELVNCVPTVGTYLFLVTFSQD
jgi:periplasmic protein TonB